jgi:4-diphosphocytidyl-2-C-methyl-D-erythritol kinase
MLNFPNCKINLGLHVTEKRADGYHNIETVFYPLNWCDVLEIIESRDTSNPFAWSQSGIAISGNTEDNLIYKAWKLINEHVTLPPIKVHLHKTLPMGAGLGGGSSDAAHFINLADTKFQLHLGADLKLKIASQLGSDCAFFIKNTPIFAQGRGDEFSAIHVDLSPYFILLVYPAIHSNTKKAYEGLIPKKPLDNLREVITSSPITKWKDLLVNDFEASLFKKYPEIEVLKTNLYTSGAVYASLSGSGSSVFGIFKDTPDLSLPAAYKSFLQQPQTKIL